MSEAEIESTSIVLIGDFNPKVFQPAWLSREGLVRKREADEAEVTIIHPEIVDFRIDGYRVRVTREQFVISTTQAPFVPIIRDLTVGTFQILSHTPLKFLGINTEAHYKVISEDVWHRFGHKLAPKQGVWDDILVKPGTRTVTIEGQRPDEHPGYIRVTVAPSTRVHPGLHFQVNDHFEAKDPVNAIGSEEILEIVEGIWKMSSKRSKQIIEKLLSEVEQ